MNHKVGHYTQEKTMDTDRLGELSALYEILSIPTSQISRDELGAQVLDKVTRLLGAPVAVLYRWQDDPETSQIWQARGLSAAEAKEVRSHGPAIMQAIADDRPMAFDGPHSVQALGLLPPYFPVRQGLSVPIHVGSSVKAVLFAFRLSDSRFLQIDLSLFSALADRTGTAIENIDLFAQAECRQRALEREIAERRQVEEKLEHYAAELERSNAELERFAYVASHDLQEPLRMIASYLQLLKRRYDEQLDQDAQDFIAYAVDGAVRMQTLINDLLAYSRVGTRDTPLAWVDTEQVLHTAMSNLQIVIEENHAVVTHVPLPTVMADQVQLAQVFQNLIGNAIKFHAADIQPQIRINVERQDGHWCFSVQDNGIGIAPEHLDRLFVIFRRLHTREEYPGTGIGLAICKRIVERHGGSIWVTSEPGNGATFHFTIPAIGVGE